MKYIQQESEVDGNTGVHRAQVHRPPAESITKRKSSMPGSVFERLTDMLDNNFWLWSVITMGITALIIGWWIMSEQGPGEAQLFGEVMKSQEQPDSTVNKTIEQLDEKLTGLADRVEMLTDSITYLESKLIRAHVLTDSIITAGQSASHMPPKETVATGEKRAAKNLMPSSNVQTIDDAVIAETHSGSSAVHAAASRETKDNATANVVTGSTQMLHSENTLTRGAASTTRNADVASDMQAKSTKTMRSTANSTAVTELHMPVTNKSHAASDRGGPWVVNLISSPDKDDADRFAEKAQSRGIETHQQQVTVKGKRYWRVQTGSFLTADEAQSYAGIVRGKLGLPDVWIMRR